MRWPTPRCELLTIERGAWPAWRSLGRGLSLGHPIRQRGNHETAVRQAEKAGAREAVQSPRALFASMGIDMDLLRRLLADEVPPEEQSLEDMVDALLSAQPEELDDMPSVEARSELAEELESVLTDAAGGDSEAPARH